MRLEKETKDRLNTIEVEHKLLLDSLGKYMNELNQLKARLSLIITLHRNELGLLGVDVEKWLEKRR